MTRHDLRVQGGFVRNLWPGIIAGLVVALPLVAKETKVGYIDSDRIIAQYEGAIDAKRQLDEDIAKFEARADSLKTEYEQAKSEYESQQLTLSEEGKRAKAAEVDQRKQRYDAYLGEVYGKNGRIDQRNQELISPIVQKIDSMVSRTALEEGFSVVLDMTKAGIVYAEPGLDLTQLVIDELNRELEPVAAVTNQKKLYAIMPIYNNNDQAAQDGIGPKLQDFLQVQVAQQRNTDVIPAGTVGLQVSQRNYQSLQIGQQQALDVARALNADYAIYGDCTKQDRRIQFSLSLLDVRLNTVIKTQSGEALRVEDLTNQAGEVLRTLLASLGQQ
jgi:outer membrane protein